MPIVPSLLGGATLHGSTISSSGSQITASASANTKGSFTTLTSGAGWDADGFFLNALASTASRDYLIDIALGGAGSEQIILNNYYISSGSLISCVHDVYIPIPVPANTRVSARIQSGTGSTTCFIGLVLVAGNNFKALAMPYAQTFGANTADSGGTSVDPGGTANTYGSYVQLSSALPESIKYAIMCVGCGNNFVRTSGNHTFEMAVGGAGSEQSSWGGTYVAQDATSDNFFPQQYSRYCHFAKGERLSVRQRSSIIDASDRLADVVVIGFC